MEVVSFWGSAVSESEPLKFVVPEGANLKITQLTLVESCSNTTTLWVKTKFVGEEVDSEDEDDEEKESISEPSSEDDENVTVPNLVIGHLTWGRQESLRTQLSFGSGEQITITAVGDGEVHVAGHLESDPNDDLTPEDDEEYEEDEEDEGHAILYGDVEEASDDDGFEEIDSDEESVEYDSDEGETVYEHVPNGILVEELDSSDSEDQAIIESIKENGMDISGDSESDDDSDDEHVLSVAEARRLLLGPDASEVRPEDSDDDSDEDAELIAAFAHDDDEDNEFADEAAMIREAGHHKKRGRPSDSPNGHVSKKQKKFESNGYGNHHYRKNHKKY